jgi:hypothetical protein
MKTYQSTDIAPLHYSSEEVLTNEVDRINRMIDLTSAMSVTNLEHEEIGIIVRLRSGEEVEILSSMIDVEDDSVEVRGGHLIPIRAIVRVEI